MVTESIVGTTQNDLSIAVGELYAGYVLDDSMRPRVASGGIVSAILIDLLERSQIDGALVSRITAIEGNVRAVTNVARSREEILAHGGSAYVDTPVLQKIAEIRDIPGRYAVVTLPCQARTLKKQLARNPELAKKFSPIISVFCRGNVTETFYEDYFRKEHIDPAQVEAVRVRRGHLQGDVIVVLKNGEEYIVPFLKINAYRLAGVHPKSLCVWCDEHLGASADIAVGDIFMPEFKQRKMKYSSFIANTEAAAALLTDMHERGRITAEYVGMERYHREFSRIERFSDNLASRYVAARLTGEIVPRTPKTGQPRFFHILAWIILLRMKQLSESKRGRRFLFWLPASAIKALAFLVKGLSRL